MNLAEFLSGFARTLCNQFINIDITCSSKAYFASEHILQLKELHIGENIFLFMTKDIYFFYGSC